MSIDINDDSSALPDESLSIGQKTWMYICEIEDELDIRAKNILTGVRSFYKAVVTTMFAKFSFKDKLISIFK